MFATGQSDTQSVVIDGVNVYWTNYGGDTVMSCNLAGCGGKPTVIAKSPLTPNAIATDGTNVYWATSNGMAILRCPVTGCGSNPPVVIVDNTFVAAIAVDDTSIYFTAVSPNATSYKDGAVLKIPK